MYDKIDFKKKQVTSFAAIIPAFIKTETKLKGTRVNLHAIHTMFLKMNFTKTYTSCAPMLFKIAL